MQKCRNVLAARTRCSEMPPSPPPCGERKSVKASKSDVYFKRGMHWGCFKLIITNGVSGAPDTGGHNIENVLLGSV